MNAHVVETVIPESGEIKIKNYPFQPGDNVQIIMLKLEPRKAGNARTFTMRGLPLTYIDPTEPVAMEDWEALK